MNRLPSRPTRFQPPLRGRPATRPQSNRPSPMCPAVKRYCPPQASGATVNRAALEPSATATNDSLQPGPLSWKWLFLIVSLVSLMIGIYNVF